MGDEDANTIQARTVRDRTYLISNADQILLHHLEFNLDMKKSQIINLCLDWLAKSAKDICSMYGCSTVEAKRYIAGTIYSEGRSKAVADIFSMTVPDTDVPSSEYVLEDRSELVEKTYLITERNVSLLDTMCFNMVLDKSEVVGMGIKWLARTFREVCALAACSNAVVMRMMLDLLAEESYSGIIAQLISSSIVQLNEFDEMIGMRA